VSINASKEPDSFEMLRNINSATQHHYITDDLNPLKKFLKDLKQNVSMLWS